MKIGFVLDDSLDKPDGVQQYILTLGRHFSKQGHEVHYLVGETKRKDIPNIHSLSRNLAVRFNQNRMSIPFPANKRAINKLLNEEKFDILHVQAPYSPMLGARVIKAAPTSTAVIGTFHIFPFSWIESVSSKILGLYLWRSLRRFDDFLGASKPAALAAKKAFRKKAKVITNTVDLNLFRSGKPIKKYQDGKINIVFLGRLVPRKGAPHFLEAIQKLHKEHHLDNVRVLICGKGPLDSQLKKYVINNHLQNIVHFLGFVSEEEKPDILASANLAVFPSLGGECFGIVLIEAMAADSQVVIGGNNPGYSSVIGSRNDQMIDPLNTDKFAATLKHFITSGRARQQANNWQKREVEKYDVKVIGDQLLHVYHQAIAKRNKYTDNKA